MTILSAVPDCLSILVKLLSESGICHPSQVPNDCFHVVLSDVISCVSKKSHPAEQREQVSASRGLPVPGRVEGGPDGSGRDGGLLARRACLWALACSSHLQEPSAGLTDGRGGCERECDTLCLTQSSWATCSALLFSRDTGPCSCRPNAGHPHRALGLWSP